MNVPVPIHVKLGSFVRLSQIRGLLLNGTHFDGESAELLG